MVHCCILGCKSHSARRDENIAFHRFPRDSSVQNIWINATGRQDWQPTKESRICSKHFEAHCYKRTNKCTLLNYGSVPQLLVQSSEEMELDIIQSKASGSEQNEPIVSHDDSMEGFEQLDYETQQAQPHCKTNHNNSASNLADASGEKSTPAAVSSEVMQTTSNRMTGTMSTVAEDAAPVKEERESDGAVAGGAGDFYVVVKKETLELEVGPEQLQPQDVALAVKEEPGTDEDESGLVMDDGAELKMEVEVGPEELQPPDDAGRARSAGRTLAADDTPTLSPRVTLIDGKLSSRKCHIYCSVFGCLTNDLENPELSFFKIPVETERRIQWLQLILREDLIEKTTINRVCEIHFNPQDIRKSMRKTLKNNSLPCLNLPNKLKEDKQTQTTVDTAMSSSQTDLTPVSNISNQTERTFLVSDNETQTPASLSADSPRKRKLKTDVKDWRKRVKELNDQTAAESQIHMLHELCDRFLSSDLAVLVKAQTNLIQS